MLRVNERIRANVVRVIDGDQMLGVFAIREALARAREHGLDLIEVDPRAVPPVCKIVEAGKYAYEQRKRANATRARRARQAKSSRSEMKEIRLRPQTDAGDLAVKARAARRLLDDGYGVKLVVKFRGREIVHPEKGREQLDAIVAALGGAAVVGVGIPRLEGRTMAVVLRAACHEHPIERYGNDGDGTRLGGVEP